MEKECLNQYEERLGAQCGGMEKCAVPFAKRHFTVVLLRVRIASESHNDECQVIKPPQNNSSNCIAHDTITIVAKILSNRVRSQSSHPVCDVGLGFADGWIDGCESFMGGRLKVH
jgi:hypothetical protein